MTNSLLICPGGPALSAITVGQIIEDFNRIISTTPRTNVSVGANSIDNFAHALLLDLGFSEQIGFAHRSYFLSTDGQDRRCLGLASSGAPAVDILNRPRPAGGASILKAVGAYERHNTAVQETSVTQAGSSAIKIIGPGDHQFQIPVDAVSTVISIYTRYDTNHDTAPRRKNITGERRDWGCDRNEDGDGGR